MKEEKDFEIHVYLYNRFNEPMKMYSTKIPKNIKGYGNGCDLLCRNRIYRNINKQNGLCNFCFMSDDKNVVNIYKISMGLI